MSDVARAQGMIKLHRKKQTQLIERHAINH